MRNYEKYYGKENLTNNSHVHLNLPSQVPNHGLLFYTSCIFLIQNYFFHKNTEKTPLNVVKTECMGKKKYLKKKGKIILPVLRCKFKNMENRRLFFPIFFRPIKPC